MQKKGLLGADCDGQIHMQRLRQMAPHDLLRRRRDWKKEEEENVQNVENLQSTEKREKKLLYKEY